MEHEDIIEEFISFVKFHECHSSVMKASWNESNWRRLKTLEMLEDTWRCLKTFEDAWRCLVMHDDISIMHMIERHHPCNQQASSMESTSIIHGINKHYVINKRQECYSIIDNIASLIATFKRYALVRYWEHVHILELTWSTNFEAVV